MRSPPGSRAAAAAASAAASAAAFATAIISAHGSRQPLGPAEGAGAPAPRGRCQAAGRLRKTAAGARPPHLPLARWQPAARVPAAQPANSGALGVARCSFEQRPSRRLPACLRMPSPAPAATLLLQANRRLWAPLVRHCRTHGGDSTYERTGISLRHGLGVPYDQHAAYLAHAGLTPETDAAGCAGLGLRPACACAARAAWRRTSGVRFLAAHCPQQRLLPMHAPPPRRRRRFVGEVAGLPRPLDDPQHCFHTYYKEVRWGGGGRREIQQSGHAAALRHGGAGQLGPARLRLLCISASLCSAGRGCRVQRQAWQAALKACEQGAPGPWPLPPSAVADRSAGAAAWRPPALPRSAAWCHARPTVLCLHPVGLLSFPGRIMHHALHALMH